MIYTQALSHTLFMTSDSVWPMEWNYNAIKLCPSREKERERLEKCVKEKTEQEILLTGSFSVFYTCPSAHTHMLSFDTMTCDNVLRVPGNIDCAFLA